MALTLECGCKFHKIEFATYELGGKLMIDILIYQHKSFVTGKLLKKPKLLGDVSLLPETTNCLIESIKNGNL